MERAPKGALELTFCLDAVTAMAFEPRYAI